MKVTVIMPFKDKKENKVRNTGDVFDCTEERFAEIKAAGRFVKAVKEDQKPAETVEKK